MRIEVDTQRDSKEELTHLANMLKAIAGTSSVSRDVSVQKQSNIFEDSSPSLGVFNMFGDSSSQPAQQAQQAQAYPSAYSQTSSSQSASSPAQSGGADIFSLFSSSPAGASADGVALNASQSSQSETPLKVSSGRELLEDERIVPY